MQVSDDYEEHDDCFSVCIVENELKGFQIRLTVSEFRGLHYIGLRKWYVDINDDWNPTMQGFSWAYNLESSSKLFCALTKILSESEVLHDVLDKMNYDIKFCANVVDNTHPRYLAGYEQGLKDAKDAIEKEKAIEAS